MPIVIKIAVNWLHAFNNNCIKLPKWVMELSSAQWALNHTRNAFYLRVQWAKAPICCDSMHHNKNTLNSLSSRNRLKPILNMLRCAPRFPICMSSLFQFHLFILFDWSHQMIEIKSNINQKEESNDWLAWIDWFSHFVRDNLPEPQFDIAHVQFRNIFDENICFQKAFPIHTFQRIKL